MEGIAVGIPWKAEIYSRSDSKADIKVFARLKVFFPPRERSSWKSIGDPALCLLHWLYSKYF